jgi:transposase InsO family protein
MKAVPIQKKYKVIKEMSKKRFSICLLCKIAKVSRSGYYKWRNREDSPSHKQCEDRRMKQKIRECYQKFRGIYGYRRVQTWLKVVYGLHVNHKRIQRLMKELKLKAIIRKKRPYYRKREAFVLSSNHLNREFKASQPNQKWVTDITYLIFNGQSLYLSAIKDLYNNEIVAYKISSRNDLKLVMDTLEIAKKRRNVEGVLIHSDQGIQYTSRAYHRFLKANGMKVSMSRKGNCWDNACIESFFSHFKSECFYLYKFQTANEVKNAVHQYINFYNHERFQRKLNNLSPYQYRTQAA